MLVNAAQHPGPALWQGIMLLVIAVWCVWICIKNPSERARRRSVVGMCVFGVVLLIAILAAGG